jgi:SAM-dependent methyltransferase
MKRTLKAKLAKLGYCYTLWQCKKEYESQQFVGTNERPIEYGFIFRQLAQLCPRTILDVGTGTSALPHLMRTCGFLVTSTDNIRDYWPAGMVNRHFHVLNDDITKTKLAQRFDVITCVSVLEHIKAHRAAVKSMFSLLNPRGHLLLTFPYNEGQYAENVYTLPDSEVKELPSFVTQAYSRHTVDTWLGENNGHIVEQEYWRLFTGKFWTCGERIRPPVEVGRDDLHQISCISFQRNQ